MTTGNSYLLSGHQYGDLGFRKCGSDVDTRAVDHTSHDNEMFGESRTGAIRPQPSDHYVRPLPMRALEPDVLEAVDDDVDEYATRCLSASLLDSVFELVITNAELRAGRSVVRDVLVSLEAKSDGLSISELTASTDGDDRSVSVLHVLAILRNHLLRTGIHVRLSPLLRLAVQRRYPRRATPARPGVIGVTFMRADRSGGIRMRRELA